MLLFLLGTIMLAGQPNATGIHESVDQMPYFSGCEDQKNGSENKRNCSNQRLVNYISKHLRYPDSARTLGIEGVVYINFVVNQSGVVENPTVVREIGGGCGKIALDIVKNMPNWEPGLINGEPVNVLLNLPINFSLKNNNVENEMELTWGTLMTETVSKEKLEDNLTNEITVRDAMGNTLQIVELSVVYKKGKKLKEADSRGNINQEVKRLVKKMRKGGEFVLLTTVQYKGNFVELERAFRIE